MPARPWNVEALGGTITVPAWKSKPSWYLVATEDRMIPPPAQRAMAARAGAPVIKARVGCQATDFDSDSLFSMTPSSRIRNVDSGCFIAKNEHVSRSK